MIHQRFDDTLTGKIIRIWPIVVAAIVFISAWARVNYSLTTIEKDTKNHETTDNILGQNHENRITVLETNSKEVIRRLERIEMKIDRIR